MSGEIRWSNLSFCGIPITVDPEQQEGEDLVARDGDVLIINVHVSDEGALLGATGHIAKRDDEDAA